MDQGFSPGLFPDQRENRRRLRELSAGKEVLNCFAYTCSFSVAAAAGGGFTTSVDLNKAYLDWGRENFRVNELPLDKHDFIYGDVLDWLKRFAKRNRQWDIVVLDPPTFGTTKKGRIFRAARDYQELVRLAARLLRKEGILFCSTNQRSVTPEQFLATLQSACRAEKRAVLRVEFETQPLDFRVTQGEKPYLKTFWLTLG
jgi:23S rRNA (cytosine1962-C5)-methyltransferase